jgi:hypothetical protein
LSDRVWKLVEGFGRSLRAEGLAGPCVERQGDGVEIATGFVDLIERLETRLSEQPLDRLVPVVRNAGGVTTPPAIPQTVASVAIEVFVELARARSGDLAVIRAFARRERALPDALRVL